MSLSFHVSMLPPRFVYKDRPRARNSSLLVLFALAVGEQRPGRLPLA